MTVPLVGTLITYPGIRHDIPGAHLSQILPKRRTIANDTSAQIARRMPRHRSHDAYHQPYMGCPVVPPARPNWGRVSRRLCLALFMQRTAQRRVESVNVRLRCEFGMNDYVGTRALCLRKLAAHSWCSFMLFFLPRTNSRSKDDRHFQ